jgi:predicted Zn-dependent protease
LELFMLKRSIFAFALVLTACVDAPAPTEPDKKPAPQVQTQPQKAEYFRTAEAGLASFNRVSARIRPQAVAICKQFSEGSPSNFCNFQFKILNSAKQPPNAYQSLARDGTPIITFNSNMLRAMKNDHEVGFVMGHEAGHQIARHLLQKRSNATAGAVLGGIIAGVAGINLQTGIDIGGAIGGRGLFTKIRIAGRHNRHTCCRTLRL